MTAPQGFDSGGFLASDVQIDSDFDTVAMSLDGRPFKKIGDWAVSGSKASTTTARSSDPKMLLETPFSDFDFRVDVGYGDALYVRYIDENNWIRVSQYMTYSTSSYNYTVNCNGYTCGGYQCNPYACAPYSVCGYKSTGFVSCGSGFNCNCVNNYTLRRGYKSAVTCVNSMSHFTARECSACASCCSTSCPSGYSATQTTYCSDQGIQSNCTRYDGQTCETCYQYCETFTPVYCASTCYQTCGQYTCYQQCAASTTNYHYPVTLRIDKKVAGTLSTVQDISLGESARCTWMRVVGVGTNIKVFSDRSPSTPHYNGTISELTGGRIHGVGRHGYGNQDSGAVLDNLVLKNAK